MYTIKVYEDEKLVSSVITDRAVIVSNNSIGMMFNNSDTIDVAVMAAKLKYASKRVLDWLVERYPNIQRDELEKQIEETLPLFEKDDVDDLS